MSTDPVIRHVVNQQDLPGPGVVGPAPRNTVSWRPADYLELFGSIAAGLATALLVFGWFAPLSGKPGFVVVFFLTFVLTYWLVVREQHGALAAKDRVMMVIVGSAAFAMMVPLVTILVSVFVQGITLLRPRFLAESMATVGPLSDAEEGGALHALIGTLQQVAIAVIISVPLGVLTAVFLNEIGGRLARPVRTIIDTMSGVPSIVAGLFIFAVWVVQFGQGFSGFAGALALSILMLPAVTRTTEEVLRLVPGGLREASLALGSKEWRTTWNVVLPTARPGVVTAVILGMSRAVGETAPLILTAFGTSQINSNPFSGSQNSLSLFAFQLVRNAEPNQIQRGYTGALLLIIVVLILFIAARVIGNRPVGGRRAKRGGRPAPDLFAVSVGSPMTDPPNMFDTRDQEDGP